MPTTTKSNGRSIKGRRSKKNAKTKKANASRPLNSKITVINTELQELADILAVTKDEIMEEANLSSNVTVIKLNKLKMLPGKTNNMKKKKSELVKKINNIQKGIETFKLILEENRYIEDTELTRQDRDYEFRANTI
jgi:uncharacterized protein YqgV (UPF0045/DUF77 family)